MTNRLVIGIVSRLAMVLPLGRRGRSLSIAQRRPRVGRGRGRISPGGRARHGRVGLLRRVTRLLRMAVGSRGLGLRRVRGLLLHGHLLLLLVQERLLWLLRLLLLLLRFRALPEDLSLLSLLGQKATRAATATHEE